MLADPDQVISAAAKPVVATNAVEAKKLIDESGLKVESVILLQEAADKVADVLA